MAGTHRADHPAISPRTPSGNCARSEVRSAPNTPPRSSRLTPGAAAAPHHHPRGSIRTATPAPATALERREGGEGTGAAAAFNPVTARAAPLQRISGGAALRHPAAATAPEVRLLARARLCPAAPAAAETPSRGSIVSPSPAPRSDVVSAGSASSQSRAPPSEERRGPSL